MWNGFESIQFEFEGRSAVVVLPEVCVECPTLAIKTEYWGAFPDTELELLRRGYYLCYIANDNRWGTDADLERKARFVRHVIAEHSLAEHCVAIGMSCGGLFAIKFAARYPELVGCLYLDAPVLNYMSCPCGFGIGQVLDGNPAEILGALSMQSMSELICYRDMPMDNIQALIDAAIPVVMVAGDSDRTVPYVENGLLLERAYRACRLPFEVYIKSGCDHHPHGLDNPATVVDFIDRNKV